MSSLDVGAIGVGAGAAMAIAVPAAVAAQVLDRDDGAPGGLLVALFLAVLVGLAVGGHTAARRAPDAPLTNGALAALAAYLLVQGIGAARLAAIGESIDLAAVPFFAVVSLAAGVTGATVAERRRPRS